MPRRRQRPACLPGADSAHPQRIEPDDLAKRNQAQGRLSGALPGRVWVREYGLEERWQRYAESGKRLLEACVCVALAMLRLTGVRDV
jgi:hypothetical protein